MNGLMKKYDRICIVESSGIPDCKMALSFMSLLFPDRVSLFTKQNPHGNKRTGPKPSGKRPSSSLGELLPGKDSALQRAYNTCVDYAKLLSYLFQSFKYDEGDPFFSSPRLENFADRMKEHDAKSLAEENGIEDEIARTLAKSHFMLELGFADQALGCLDKPLEYIFCFSLPSPKGPISFDYMTDEGIKKLYKDYSFSCKKKPGKTNRPAGMLNAIGYAFDPKLGKKKKLKVQKDLVTIDKLWEAVSHRKHLDTFAFSLEDEHLDMIVGFNETLRMKYDEEKKYYQMVLSAFPDYSRKGR